MKFFPTEREEWKTKYFEAVELGGNTVTQLQILPMDLSMITHLTSILSASTESRLRMCASAAIVGAQSESKRHNIESIRPRIMFSSRSN
jgi:hypothetical protein